MDWWNSLFIFSLSRFISHLPQNFLDSICTFPNSILCLLPHVSFGIALILKHSLEKRTKWSLRKKVKWKPCPWGKRKLLVILAFFSSVWLALLFNEVLPLGNGPAYHRPHTPTFINFGAETNHWPDLLTTYHAYVLHMFSLCVC